MSESVSFDVNVDAAAGTAGASSAAAASSTSQSTATTQENLFPESMDNGTVTTTTRADTFTSSSGTSSADSAEMTQLKAELADKQSVVDTLDEKIAENATLREEKSANYTAASEAVTAASETYSTAAANYAAAQAELEELQDTGILAKLANTITQKIQNAKAKVAELKAEAEQAYEDYETALEEKEEAREEYVAALTDGIALKKERVTANEEVAAVQEKIDALSAKENKEAAETDEANKTADGTSEEGAVDGETEDGTESACEYSTEELTALAEQYGIEIPEGASDEEILAAIEAKEAEAETGDTAALPDSGAEEAITADELEQEYKEIMADIAQIEQLTREATFETQNKMPDIRNFDISDSVNTLLEYFCDGLSASEIRTMGLSILDILDEATQAYQAKLTSTAYSKSGSIALADSATTEEHSAAQSEFTEAVLDVSDIINRSDIEFYNVSDESNYELANNVLSRINSGEYIKTDTLEKQTTTVKNIQVTNNTSVEAADSSEDKYSEYSNALLDELNHLVSDSGDGLSEEEYNVIETTFNLKATKDIEDAFEYLEGEAVKRGITSAVNEYDT